MKDSMCFFRQNDEDNFPELGHLIKDLKEVKDKAQKF